MFASSPRIVRLDVQQRFSPEVDPSAPTGFRPILGRISQDASFSNSSEFNQFCRRAIDLWRESFPGGYGAIRELGAILEQIDSAEEIEGKIKIPTGWGGVLVEKFDVEYVEIEKYLAVRSGGYLAFEKHDLKEEKLVVREGAGLLLYQPNDSDRLFITVLSPGDEHSFNPGRLHCIIGVEDLLVYEISKDHKGMDQDLVFLFEPDGQA